MSKARHCQVGDRVTTNYTRSSITEHTITGRKDMQSQSGIGFQVYPPLGRAGRETWIDADWFEPVLLNSNKKPPTKLST